MKKPRSTIKGFFNEFFTPNLPEPKITLKSSSFPYIGDGHESKRYHRENIETMMVADLKLQWEAQRRTLVLVQRTALISILSLIVAIAALAATYLKG